MQAKRRLLMLMLCLPVTLAAAAEEDLSPPAPPEPPVPVRAVIELFTSQGCSSCPPADALLKTLSERKDIIALTLPVDYWDYIGWKDTLASSRNTERQRAYADAFGSGPIYTPQVVVNGAAQALGSDANEIRAAIDATYMATASRRVPVNFWNYGNNVIIETGAAPPGSEVKDATIWMAVVEKSVSVSVKSGENAGKTLTYTNVVHELTPIGLWNGRPSTIRLAMASVMRPEIEALIVLIQEANAGPIIGAARLER